MDDSRRPKHKDVLKLYKSKKERKLDILHKGRWGQTINNIEGIARAFVEFYTELLGRKKTTENILVAA